MNISLLKDSLRSLEEVTFVLPNGSHIPPHFHVTEVGIVSKHFVDCGGTIRKESTANFQLWSADDFDHRINPKTILEIIQIAEDSIALEDLEIEVEYQSDTICKYGLSFDGSRFRLTPTQTDCLAKEKCGIPKESVENADSSCDPSSGCC